MGKIKSPISLGTQFAIDEGVLETLDVIDVLLEADTLLFIDPMLLSVSKHPEMNLGAAKSYKDKFTKIIKLLSASKAKDDVAWKAAKKQFKFSEVSWTCLGYGSGTRGSGFGKDLVETTLDTASQIISLGIEDTDLFMAMALFEEGIGPDRISDMTTNIILDDLIAFNHRVNGSLNLPVSNFEIDYGHERKIQSLIINPLTLEPLLLVPRDVVRALPIANSWGDISQVVKENEELRTRVNRQFGEILATMTRKKKDEIKQTALKSRAGFNELLSLLKSVDPEPYDFDADRNGEVFWSMIAKKIAQNFPVDLSQFRHKLDTRENVKKVVDLIVDQFKELIENKGLWKELWTESGEPRKEKAAQRLFYAVAYSYCKANDLDLSPEVDSGSGPVDFKVSKGFNARILVELKLSKGTVVHGYKKQLEIYKEAEDTPIGIFLIIDIGLLGKKYGDVQRIRRERIDSGEIASDIVLVDGNERASASKR
ncbi:hypothetical protein [Shewanella xiamenensis]|uniref:hypothetical protein n=1 Tax=Shewanella xiamenensis TaxID=332186 RepID=UPI00313D905E